jgi:hypothetical protein
MGPISDAAEAMLTGRRLRTKTIRTLVALILAALRHEDLRLDMQRSLISLQHDFIVSLLLLN